MPREIVSFIFKKCLLKNTTEFGMDLETVKYVYLFIKGKSEHQVFIIFTLLVI